MAISLDQDPSSERQTLDRLQSPVLPPKAQRRSLMEGREYIDYGVLANSNLRSQSIHEGFNVEPRTLSTDRGDSGNDQERAAGAVTRRITFQFKLYDALQEAARSGKEDIIRWQSHGRAFQVLDKMKFEHHIMPSFFGTARFLSFKRQLSVYGFTRVRSGYDKHCFFSELFLRGRPDLLPRIKRIPRGVSTTPILVPNFYDLPICRELSSDEVRRLCALSVNEEVKLPSSSMRERSSTIPKETESKMADDDLNINPGRPSSRSIDRESFINALAVGGQGQEEQLNPARIFDFNGTIGSTGKRVKSPSGETRFELP